MTDAGTLVTGPHEWVTCPGRQRHGLWTQLDELRARPGGGDRGWPAPGRLYRPLAAVEWLEVPRNGPRSTSEFLRHLVVQLRSPKSRWMRPFRYVRGVTPPAPFSSTQPDWRSAASTHRRGPFP